MDIKRLDTLDSDFRVQLDKLLAWDSTSDEAVFKTVSEILKSVKNQGDSAVLDFSLRFDGLKAKNLAELEMPLDRLREAYDGIEYRDREALEQAAARIRAMRNIRNSNHGNTPRLTERCLANKLRRWIGSDFTCPVARQPIHPRY